MSGAGGLHRLWLAAGALAQGTGGPPPLEKFVPGTSGPLSHIMLIARGVVPAKAAAMATWKRPGR